MTGLQISNLKKSYGVHTVLELKQWSVTSGISWLKGGNGTGKTTLFKFIAGQTPFKGDITLNEVALRKAPVKYRAMISFAEAEPQYPSFITGNDLLDYYLSIRRATRATILPLIDQFQMGEFMGNKIETYSSGMLKKLSLICAFTGNAHLFLFDEPLITIDNAAALVLYEHIDQLKKRGCIVLISSHQEIDSEKVDLLDTFVIQEKQIKRC